MKLKQIRVSGYKNLIDCKVDLGDFNVIVGPNNSGKSNLLEALQMINVFCFSDDKTREAAFRGFGNSICHLSDYVGIPLEIGVTFETKLDGKDWLVDYDFSVERSGNIKEGKFISESLKAKPTSQPGPRITYISREENQLKIGSKVCEITSQNPSLIAIKSLYPGYKGLPSEIEIFIKSISDIASSHIFAISPERVRDSSTLIKEKSEMGSGIRISSFDLLQAIDSIQENKIIYEIFKETLCDILDLDNAAFISGDIPESKDKKLATRYRIFNLQKAGDTFAPIDEYSDGTFIVTAILAAMYAESFNCPVFMFEELENCLHPAALQKLLRFLQDHTEKWPILITTHSPYLLNGVKPEDVNVAVVDKKGAAHFEKVKNSKQLRDYLNKNLISFGDLLLKDFDGFREGNS